MSIDDPITVDTLAGFLLARIAEDEHAARGARPLSCLSSWVEVSSENIDRAERHFGRWEAVRVLAECEAKRRIVALHAGAFGCPVCWENEPLSNGPVLTAEPPHCDTLRLLALPYADHEDFRDEWRPGE